MTYFCAEIEPPKEAASCETSASIGVSAREPDEDLAHGAEPSAILPSSPAAIISPSKSSRLRGASAQDPSATTDHDASGEAVPPRRRLQPDEPCKSRDALLA